MTDARPTSAQGLVKLAGTIANYACTRCEASFVFNDSDRTKLGVVAMAAGIAGLSKQAISTAANATCVEEQVDSVEFDLDGQPVKGWVWRSPFNDGDVVESRPNGVSISMPRVASQGLLIARFGFGEPLGPWRFDFSTHRAGPTCHFFCRSDRRDRHHLAKSSLQNHFVSTR